MSGAVHQLDIVIVGGGVIGLTTALELRRLLGSAGKIAVLDQSEPGREASWAGAGIIPPGDWASGPVAELASLSNSLWPHLSRTLRETTGIENGYRTCGSIEVCDSIAQADAEIASWKQIGIEALAMDQSQPLAFAKNVRCGPGAAYVLPTTAQVRNPWHLQALQQAVQQRDEIFPQCEVNSFQYEGDRIVSVGTTQGHFAADRVLIAAGAWTSRVCTLLNRPILHVDIEPVRGQMALLKVADTTGWPIVEQGKRYLVPRSDGHVLAGSTEEHVGFEKGTRPDDIQTLIDFAIGLVRELKHASLTKTWSGLRPFARRGLPYIGPYDGYSNLFIAAGHFRAGLSLSPATGKVIAELMLDLPPSLPAQVLAQLAPETSQAR